MMDDAKLILKYVWAVCNAEHPNAINGAVAITTLDADIMDWAQKLTETLLRLQINHTNT